MTRFAVALSIGPVGDFIASGRRSRDLWYGSRLLSELTRRVAFALHQTPGSELLLPHLKRITEDLFYFPGIDTMKDPEKVVQWERYKRPTISNRIRCIVSADDPGALRILLQRARDQAHEWLATQIGLLVQTPGFDALDCDMRALEEQRQALRAGDFLEIQGAYQSLVDDSKTSRQAAIVTAERLLGSAKNTRAFRTADFSKPGRRKSSQDAGRDSVLFEGGDAERKAEQRVRRWTRGLRSDERLDAVALLRRHAVLRQTPAGQVRLRVLPFPPLHRVAADPWLQGVKDNPMLREVRSRLESLRDTEVLPLLSSPCREPKQQRPPLFPFDPTLLYDGGLGALERELERSPQRELVRQAVAALHQLRGPVTALHEKHGVPSPYFALLTADGDGMGTTLAKAFREKYDTLVAGLYKFADDAWDLIDDHRGCAFYAGGDELAAYLPMDEALAAAVKLQEIYQENVVDAEASLSVGIVIAHVKEDLRATRRHAQEALDHAKRARRQAGSKVSWLCVDERPRGGTPRSCVAPTQELRERIDAWRLALREGLVSMKTAHDLRTLKERFSDVNLVNGGDAGLVLAKAMAQQKAQRRDDGQDKVLIDKQRQRFSGLQSWDDVQQLINELLLAAHVDEISEQRGARAEVTNG